MTQNIRIESRVGEDGILMLRVPFAPSDANLDVVVTIQPRKPVAESWPPGYFEQTYGSLADDPVIVPDDPIPLPEVVE